MTISTACISLVPRPAREGEEKRAWFPLFAHALNRGGSPPAPRTFKSGPYPCDVKADTKRYMVRTVIVVMACVSVADVGLL